jgi:hypothetical protein
MSLRGERWADMIDDDSSQSEEFIPMPTMLQLRQKEQQQQLSVNNGADFNKKPIVRVQGLFSALITGSY